MREFNTAVVRVKDDSGGYKSLSALRGESSYAIAVQNGFEGTEEEWMESIIGDGWIGAYQDLEVLVNNAQAAADKAQETADNNQLIIEKEVTTPIARSRLDTDALYSPINWLNEATNTLSANHLGKTLLLTGSANDHIFSISKDASDALPIGFEAAIVFWSGQSAKIVFSGDIRAYGAGMNAGGLLNPTFEFPELYTMIAVKKISSDNVWLVTGNVEVVS